jgi:ABC-type sugar transport system substrate-binding protein
MKRGIVLFIVIALAVAMLVGCAKTPAEPSGADNNETAPASTSTPDKDSDAPTGDAAGEKPRLAFIATSNVDESMKWFLKCAQEEAEAQGCELVAFDPNGDVQKQANMIGEAVAAKYDAIIMQCLDEKALIPALKKAKEAGLTICLFGADIDESGHQYRDLVCAPNDLDAGKLAAETVKEQFPNGATGVMIMGGAGSDPAIRRETGFEEGIKGSNITLLDKQNCLDWDAAKAMATMEDFITKYGDKIQFVYSHWDNGSTTIVEAIEAKGMKDVYIVSVDGCRAGFDLVNDGKIASTLYQDMALQVQECIRAAIAKKNGEQIADPIKFVPWTVITKDNANFDPGW